LIVLNLGLDAGVIDVEQFTIFVLMALVTTFATCPGMVGLLLRGLSALHMFLSHALLMNRIDMLSSAFLRP